MRANAFRKFVGATTVAVVMLSANVAVAQDSEAVENEETIASVEVETAAESAPAVVETESVSVVQESEPESVPVVTESEPTPSVEAETVAPEPAQVAVEPEPEPIREVAPVAPEPAPVVQAQVAPTAAPAEPRPANESSRLRMSVGVGGAFIGNFGGGVTWANPPVEQVTMPYNIFGGYVFFDMTYAEVTLGYYAGGGKWDSPNVSDVRNLPELRRSVINIGAFLKPPFTIGTLTAFPLLGIDYDIPVSGSLEFARGVAGETETSVTDLAALWIKLGVGGDIDMGSSMYMRISALYGIRAFSSLEDNYVESIKNNLGHNDVEANPGHGLTFRVGIGYRF